MQTDFMGISFTLIEVIHTSHTMALQNQMKHQSYFYYFDKFLFNNSLINYPKLNNYSFKKRI